MNKTVRMIYGIIVIALTLIALVSIGLVFFDRGIEFKVNVIPTERSGNLDATLREYGNSKVEPRGALVLKDPDLFQKIIWPPEGHRLSDFFGSIFVFFVGINVLFIFRDYREKNVFRNNIYKHLRRIGWAFVIFHLVNLVRRIILKSQVLDLTGEGFRFYDSLEGTFQIWVGVLLLWLSLIIQKGFKLQNEQDLTI
jgi:hypothetical protein